MTAAPTLRAGKTAWRIVPKATPSGRTGYGVIRCVIMRVLPDLIETAPHLRSLARATERSEDVFADEAAARAEAQRRRDQGKLL